MKKSFDYGLDFCCSQPVQNLKNTSNLICKIARIRDKTIQKIHFVKLRPPPPPLATIVENPHVGFEIELMILTCQKQPRLRNYSLFKIMFKDVFIWFVSSYFKKLKQLYISSPKAYRKTSISKSISSKGNKDRQTGKNNYRIDAHRLEESSPNILNIHL